MTETLLYDATAPEDLSTMYLLFQDLVDDGVRPLTTFLHTEEALSRTPFSSPTIMLALEPLMPASHARRQIHRCYQKFRVTPLDIKITIEWKIQLLTANEILRIISQRGSDCMVETLVEYRIKTPRPGGHRCTSLSEILHSARQDESILKVTWKRQTFKLMDLIRSRSWFTCAQICWALSTDYMITVWNSFVFLIRFCQCHELSPLFLLWFSAWWEEKIVV